jgi:hypothetical protein
MRAVVGCNLRKRCISVQTGAFRFCVVLGILMYNHLHPGSCAPRA